MNWGQIQIESLKKMFLNNDDLIVKDLETYRKDKKYKTYLFAMPQAANEAIMYILENVQPLIKKYTLTEQEDDDRYDMGRLPNFKRIYQVVNDGGHYFNYLIEGNNQLVIKDWKNGNIIIYYESYVDPLTTSSSVNTDLELPTYLLSAIPLYIAGELYKEDDIQLSTMYMNEFFNLVDGFKEKDYNSMPSSVQTVFSGGY